MVKIKKSETQYSRIGNLVTLWDIYDKDAQIGFVRYTEHPVRWDCVEDNSCSFSLNEDQLSLKTLKEIVRAMTKISHGMQTGEEWEEK